MQPHDTVFGTGWWGPEINGIRESAGTYGRYSYDQLPALPFKLCGDFEWLKAQAEARDNIAREKPKENARALARLLADASDQRFSLPKVFLQFFGCADLQRRVRSCTDCFLDLSPVFVLSPVAGGSLVRFLADSQGCMFWYLYLSGNQAEHCVVSSPGFYGAEEEQWQIEPPNPDEIVFCEESFERFLCRFWLENEIWYFDYEKRPIFPAGRKYLDDYAAKSP
jgi:hypothetical protein